MKQTTNNIRIKPFIFFPAFILIVLTLIFSYFNYDAFLTVTTNAKNFMVVQCGWIFSITAISCLLAIIAVYFSPLGKIRLGGSNAKPLLKKSSWFAITLCTTIAAGILFWGSAEPIYHLAYPPTSLGIEPMSNDAAKFAMETLFLHWTFMPYAIYAVPTIVFAFAYYNMKRPFSIGSQISPLVGEKNQHKFDTVVDAIVLFAISAAIAASFGTSVINMGGGIYALTGISNSTNLWVIITIIGTITFIISSGTGLFKGIKILSNLNVYLYYIIIIALLIFGPTVYIFGAGTESFGGFLTNIFDKALFTGTLSGDSWPNNWTTFYWSNWMAWAPISAIFLARVSYGYTIKEVVTMNFIVPSLFSTLWMAILGGTAINFQLTGKVDLITIMNEQGSGAAAYALLDALPFSAILILIYLVAVFLSFVTATDSAINAMSSICTTGITDGTQEAPFYLKIVWGSVVGIIALLFITRLGIDGIKMLSYLGGFPALFLGILSIISLILIMKNPNKFDLYSNSQQKHQKNKLSNQ